MSNNAHELRNRLLNALDSNYNVVDMRAVNEIISILERTNITKELLETTRLGKHVNELRRKTTDTSLARRTKFLVKRWRELVIPNVASPAHIGSNRSSADRQMRRLGGTPLTSPALPRQVVSPAVPSPRFSSRPAWAGYESDSQDVILVDDDGSPPLPPPAPAGPPAGPPAAAPPPPCASNTSHKPPAPSLKRPASPDPAYDDKKAKRDKKPKKRRGHSRAGAGTETGVGGEAGGESWSGRNGAAAGERTERTERSERSERTERPERRNGCRPHALDPYTALVNKIPPVGAKKVKTTKELLEEIQSRGSRPVPSPRSPRSPASPDVMVIEPDPSPMVKVESPMRNGDGSPPRAAWAPAPEDERPYVECSCAEGAAGGGPGECPAAARRAVRPLDLAALHHAYVPGVNGTRAPLEPHRFAVRPAARPDCPHLFNSVVPLYNYSSYADDYCVKNMSRVPLCTHLPWTEFAPPPPDLPPPPSPPPLRPYPVDTPSPRREDAAEDAEDSAADAAPVEAEPPPRIHPEMMSVPTLEPSDRLKPPILSTDEESQFPKCAGDAARDTRPRSEPDSVARSDFKSEERDHRTVEKTKDVEEVKAEPAGVLDGRTIYALCGDTLRAVPYTYEQALPAGVLPLPGEGDALPDRLACGGEGGQERDPLGRPPRPAGFAEWHECARLGDLIALPYVVID